MNTYPSVSRGLQVRSSASTARLHRGALRPLKSLWVAVIALVGASVSSVHAQIAYDESVSGDLSNSGLTPTVVAVHPGSNLIFGTTGRVTATDRDYFTFTVPTGYVFNSLIELPGTNIGGLFSFIGLQVGPQVTLPTNATTAAGLIGWSHYDNSMIGTDLFPLLQTPDTGSSGFSGPLGPGSYSFWIQDFNVGAITYAFDVRLAPVPEPSTYAAAGGALLLALAIRRRFKKAAPVAKA